MLRCAIYTRTATHVRKEDLNTLRAQREACEAYIDSHRSEGWTLVRDQYDDDAVGGDTLTRPALQRLLADIDGGIIDVVVITDVARLRRPVTDFKNLEENFKSKEVILKVFF